MDYIIADRVALPPEYAPWFVEAVLSIPPSLLPNSHRSNYPSIPSVTMHPSRTLRGGGEREGEEEGEEDCEWGAGKVALLALYEHYKLDPQLFQRWLSLVSAHVHQPEHIHQGENVLMTSETTSFTNESSSSPASAVLVLQEGAYPLLTTPVLRRLAAKVCVCVCVCAVLRRLAAKVCVCMYVYMHACMAGMHVCVTMKSAWHGHVRAYVVSALNLILSLSLSLSLSLARALSLSDVAGTIERARSFFTMGWICWSLSLSLSLSLSHSLSLSLSLSLSVRVCSFTCMFLYVRPRAC
jgi:hypothetical protein